MLVAHFRPKNSPVGQVAAIRATLAGFVRRPANAFWGCGGGGGGGGCCCCCCLALLLPIGGRRLWRLVAAPSPNSAPSASAASIRQASHRASKNRTVTSRPNLAIFRPCHCSSHIKIAAAPGGRRKPDLWRLDGVSSGRPPNWRLNPQSTACSASHWALQTARRLLIL